MTFIFRLCAAFVSVTVVTTFAAHSEDNSNGSSDEKYSISSVNMVFGRFGFHADQHISQHSCIVRMNLNQKVFLDNFETLKKIGLLNEALDRSMLFTHPNKLSLGFSLQMLVPTTRAAFDDNTDVDKCSFEEILTTLDDYGNDKEVRTLSYNFTRSLFSKINWAQFPDQNMMKVAPGFRFTPEFQSMVSSEPPLP